MEAAHINYIYFRELVYGRRRAFTSPTCHMPKQRRERREAMKTRPVVNIAATLLAVVCTMGFAGEIFAEGTVAVTVDKDSVYIMGDPADNMIEVRVDVSRNILVEGQSDTTVSGGQTGVPESRLRSLKIRLGKGNDSVLVAGMNVHHGLKIRTGDGNDMVRLDNVWVVGRTVVITGIGEDTVEIDNGTTLTRTYLDTGPLDDEVILAETASITLIGPGKIKLGDGDDEFIARNNPISLIGFWKLKGNAGTDFIDLGVGCFTHAQFKTAYPVMTVSSIERLGC
jgi:hypothetical protein